MHDADEPAFVVRPLVAADLEAFVDVYLTLAAHHAALNGWRYRVPARADAMARFVELPDDDENLHLVAEAGGRVIGALDAWLESIPGPGGTKRPHESAEIGVAVVDEWRGRGVGTALLAAAEAWARARGLEQLSLDVAEENGDARRLYERLGFEPVTQRMAKRLQASGPVDDDARSVRAVIPRQLEETGEPGA